MRAWFPALAVLLLAAAPLRSQSITASVLNPLMAPATPTPSPAPSATPVTSPASPGPAPQPAPALFPVTNTLATPATPGSVQPSLPGATPSPGLLEPFLPPIVPAMRPEAMPEVTPPPAPTPVPPATPAASRPVAAEPAKTLPGSAGGPPVADWAKAYKLGPGDVVDIRFYGRPELDRLATTVGPDGTVTYLNITGFRVAGLTIEQMRAALEAGLRRYYRTPRLLIIPNQLVSKNYTLMGMVKISGVFPLDVPLTLLEALARAGGTTSGLFDRRYVDLADLGRSFVLRSGQKLPVNFQNLMLKGDMTQNVPLEPGDYIHIASSLANDYFVLGAVKKPGREGFTENASVISAITKRGGFLPNSFRERVLIVRGSLTQPETVVVNTDRILKGGASDVLLKPKDIVYVSSRPWSKVEEMVDSAVVAFMQGAVATWVDLNAPVIFREGFIPLTPQGEEEVQKLQQ